MRIGIIGGGIIGLATGLKILDKYPDAKVLIIEKEQEIAQHQTGNNSGVIHAGIYYKPGSLKALNCRKGYHLLLDYCNHHQVEYEICGKLIIATQQSELPQLENLYSRGLANGLHNIKKIPGGALKNYEPNVSGLAGIYVPYTGIIDYNKVAHSYALNIQKNGGTLHTGQQVKNILQTKHGIEIITEDNTFVCNKVINTTGLQSDRIARLTNHSLNVRIIPFRGEYVELKPEKRSLVNNLIYPVPNPEFPFLGVHFTRMINGHVEAGPNAVWAFKREGYKKTDIAMADMLGDIRWKGFRKVVRQYWRTAMGEYYRSFSKKALTTALQQLIPSITTSDFVTGGTGVRAQACDKNGGLIDDFLVLNQGNIIHVLNAPSPAATASLAIGEKLASLV